MYNPSYFFAGAKGVDIWEDSDISLSKLKNRLDKFFLEKYLMPFPINIVWVDYAALMSDQTIYAILGKSSEGNEPYKYYRPSIIIGTQPMNVDSTDKEESLIYEKKIKQFDNNIHTYYCQIKEWEDFQSDLTKCLKRIKSNVELGLYQSQITKEYFEFYQRVIKNNKLKGGHSSAVIPFIFTSEQDMYDKALEYSKDIKKYSTMSGNLSINLLLVDDHAFTPLVAIKEGAVGLKNKKEILESVLNNFLQETKLTIKIRVRTIAEPDIGKLNTLPNEDTPDIILLDYNFNTTESGVDFIQKLIKDGSPRKGPFGKFWLFPITSFSNAFIDELQNQGLGFIDDNYELSRGADFINTPHLFLFYMMQMTWDIISRSDLKVVENEIKRVCDKVDSYKSWDKLLEDDFENDYSRMVNSAWHIECVLRARTGILNDIRENLKNNLAFRKRLSICKELLFNLTSKKYQGNEDIIILLNELKRTTN